MTVCVLALLQCFINTLLILSFSFEQRDIIPISYTGKMKEGGYEVHRKYSACTHTTKPQNSLLLLL